MSFCEFACSRCLIKLNYLSMSSCFSKHNVLRVHLRYRCVRTSFLFLMDWYSIVYTDVPHLVCPFSWHTARHLHLWAIVNDADVDTGGHVSAPVPAFSCFGHPGSGMAGFVAGLVWPFEELQTVFHCSCTKLQSQQHCTRALTSHPASTCCFLFLNFTVLGDLSAISLWFGLAFP